MKSRGFTLIEILVVVSIISTVIVVLTQVFFTTVRVSTKTELLKELRQNGDYATMVMSRMIRNAPAVICDESSPTTASIDVVGVDGNTTTLGCFADGLNVTHIASKSAGVNTIYLTSSNVSLGATCDNALTFTCSQVAGLPKKITISFQLSQNNRLADPCPKTQNQASGDTTNFEKGCVKFSTTVDTRN